MEILLEILGAVLEFGGEILLELVFEVLSSGGVRKAQARKRRAVHRPVLAALGYAFLELISGLMSLLLFPSLFLRSSWARWLNLLVTPLSAGLAMASLGSHRKRRGKTVLRLESFTYGALFAFMMAVVRLFLARQPVRFSLS